MTDLKSILEDLGESYYPWHEYGDQYVSDNKKAIDQAHQQILDWVDREIIGEDETYEGHTMNWAIEHHNHLRQDQRNKLNALKEKTDER